MAIGSAGIGFVGDGVSQLTEYAFHRNDPDYDYDPITSVTSLVYAAGANTISGLLSLGINTTFSKTIDEAAGMFVSTETSVILGVIDFGIRQIIGAILEIY